MAALPLADNYARYSCALSINQKSRLNATIPPKVKPNANAKFRKCFIRAIWSWSDPHYKLPTDCPPLLSAIHASEFRTCGKDSMGACFPAPMPRRSVTGPTIRRHIFLPARCRDALQGSQHVGWPVHRPASRQASWLAVDHLAGLVA